MRALVLAAPLFIVATVSGFAEQNIGTRQPATTNNEYPSESSKQETYRGYVLDLSELTGRKDVAAIADSLRHQLDIVESVRLSQRVLNYFHTIPILADEMACFAVVQPASMERPLITSACYGLAVPKRSARRPREFSVWDSRKYQWTNPDAIDLAQDTNGGIVMVRPLLLDRERPIALHEMLHAFHAHMLPRGFENQGIMFFYNFAKSKQLYPADSYLLTNQKEFFAVTASVFLFGKDNQEPFTRAKLKEKMPDYYKYLAWLFETDPDSAPTVSPVASAN